MVKKVKTPSKKKTTTTTLLVKPKTTTKKKTNSKARPKSKVASTKKSIVYNEQVFIENFVNLQHAMTNMSIQFGELSQNITKLLKVFEESAKTLAKTEKQIDSGVGEKIDSLLSQNKTIARGLVLMEDKLKRQAKYTPSATKINPFEPQQTFPRSQASQQPRTFQPKPIPQQGFIPQPFNPNKPKPLPQL